MSKLTRVLIASTNGFIALMLYALFVQSAVTPAVDIVSDSSATQTVFFGGQGAGVRDINPSCPKGSDIIRVFRLWPNNKTAKFLNYGTLVVPMGNGLNRMVRHAWPVPGKRYVEFTLIGKRRVNTRSWENIFVYDVETNQPIKGTLTLPASFCGDHD